MAKKRATKKKSSALRYIGDGASYLNGIPMRHLTSAEVALLTTKQLEHCLGSGLYEVATDDQLTKENSYE